MIHNQTEEQYIRNEIIALNKKISETTDEEYANMLRLAIDNWMSILESVQAM